MSSAAGVTWAVLASLLGFLVVGGAGALCGAAACRRRGDARGDEQSSAPPAAPAVSMSSMSAGLADQVLAVSRHGVVVVDRDEVVILANPAARELGVIDGDRLTVAKLTELVQQVFTTGANGGGRTIDLPPHRGGTGRDPGALSVFAAPLRATATPHAAAAAGDRPVAVALLLDDVTESRRLEAVRRDFVANVSHELKTPVGALTLLAEAVQDAADDPVAVARFAQRLQREGTRLGRLVRELIELSRLQGADPLPGEQPVRLAEVIDEAVDRTRTAAEQAGITLVVRCPPTVAVAGDSNQLVMAVSNLLDNAIAYSPPATSIGVTVQEYQQAGRAMVAVAVSDQGIGIGEADLDRVFERFYRVDPARSRATGGTGLGLAIVKHIASNHGGLVTVWSREGSGSTFTIRLPRVSAPPVLDQEPRLAPHHRIVALGGNRAGNSASSRAGNSAGNRAGSNARVDLMTTEGDR